MVLVSGSVRALLLGVSLTSVASSVAFPDVETAALTDFDTVDVEDAQPLLHPKDDNTPICNRTLYGIYFKGFVSSVHKVVAQISSHKALFGNKPNITQDNLLAFGREFCKHGMKTALANYNDSIKECNATLRTNLLKLAGTGVGFFCQPGGGGLEPAIHHVISSISQEDLSQTVNSSCKVNIDVCFEGLAKFNEEEKMSLEKIVSFFQSELEGLIRCMAEKYKANNSTCPHWRADLLIMAVGPVLTLPFLGMRLPFTAEELNDIFEL